MKAKVISIGTQEIDKAVLSEIRSAFIDGKIIAFPTETVYGIGALASNVEAIERIYQVKNRDTRKPLGIYIHSPEQLAQLCEKRDPVVSQFVETFLPGPVTVLLADKNAQTIGIRYPDNPVLLKILASLPEPLMGTSANLSGAPACVKPQDVYRQLKDKIDYIIDGGVTRYRTESTIIDCTQSPFEIIRTGAALDAVIDFFDTRGIAYRKKRSVLVVCTGNTCRSPMVEAYLRVKLEERAPGSFSVSSCGVYAPQDVSASPDAVKVLAEVGIDLSGHRSKPVDEDMVRAADRIIVMTDEHKHMLVSMFPHVTMDICVLDVADPIGRGINTYAQTFAEIQSKIEEHLQWILD